MNDEELKELEEKLYRGELRDLAHLRGISRAYPASEDLEYQGRVEF